MAEYHIMSRVQRERKECNGCGKRRLCTRIEKVEGSPIRFVTILWWCNDCLTSTTRPHAYER